ncbi:hypothetical protein DFJ74DRAFT_214773 [Hyaloraphidium curvatum]|nr:hypothetical protein DFJ74DRAFT_214773 [Hyaloraphidium curvatum]
MALSLSPSLHLKGFPVVTILPFALGFVVAILWNGGGFGSHAPVDGRMPTPNAAFGRQFASLEPADAPMLNDTTRRPLARVAFTADDSESAAERWDPRYFHSREAEPSMLLRGKRVALVGWWDNLVEPLRTFADAFVALAGANVTTFGSLSRQLAGKALDFTEELKSIDVVIWWHWSHDPAKLLAARTVYPGQIWVLINWDDPFSLFSAGNMHAIKDVFDIVFSSGSAALPTYLLAGATEAHAFVPMIDSTHYNDPDPEYLADVAFVASRSYSERGFPRNRTLIFHALVEDSRKTGLRLAIYGSDQVGTPFPEFYKGRIRYEDNRKVWSSAKISLNFHVVDGYGGWYANARNTEILGSGGLLLVDRTVDGPLRDMEDCVFLKSEEPDAIVQQIHQILENYEAYEPIRERGSRFAARTFSASILASRVIASVDRVMRHRNPR